MKPLWPYGKLATLIALTVLVPLTLGAFILRHVQDRLLATSGSNLAAMADDLADTADEIFRERYGDLQFLGKVLTEFRGDPETMTGYLTEAQRIYPLYKWLAVTDADGRVLAATDSALLQRELADRSWFRIVRDTGEVLVTDAEDGGSPEEARSATLAAPIQDGRDRFQGTVVARVELATLITDLKRVISPSGGREGHGDRIEYQILSRDGDVLADSLGRHGAGENPGRLGVRSALLVASGLSGYVEELHPRRRVPVLTGYAEVRGFGPFNGLQWGILVRMDRREILAPFRAMVYEVSVAGALLLIPLLTFLVWGARRMNHEWAQVHEQARRALETESADRSRRP